MFLESKFDFKDEVKDVVTGLQGIVVAVDFWMNGCTRVGIQLLMKKDADKYPNVCWVDSGQLEIVKKEAIKVKDHASSGGPTPSFTNNMGMK
jgi:hypothetical protein